MVIDISCRARKNIFKEEITKETILHICDVILFWGTKVWNIDITVVVFKK